MGAPETHYCTSCVLLWHQMLLGKSRPRRALGLWLPFSSWWSTDQLEDSHALHNNIFKWSRWHHYIFLVNVSIPSMGWKIVILKTLPTERLFPHRLLQYEILQNVDIEKHFFLKKSLQCHKSKYWKSCWEKAFSLGEHRLVFSPKFDFKPGRTKVLFMKL